MKAKTRRSGLVIAVSLGVALLGRSIATRDLNLSAKARAFALFYLAAAAFHHACAW